jgi:hypothetical protein
MKNVFFCDMKTQFVPHRKHITTPQQSPTGYFYVIFEVLTAVTMKNVFCDMKTQFVPHRKHITSPLQSPTGYFYVIFEVLTAVTMKNVFFWDIKDPVHTSQKTHYVSAT